MASTKISALSAGAPLLSTDKMVIARAGANNSLVASDLRNTFTYARQPYLMFDGDSKGLEPFQALKWAHALAPFEAVIGNLTTDNLSIGGSSTGNGANNLTNSTRLATMVSAVQANFALGYDVDMFLTIGTNDVVANSTLAETIIANIDIYKQAFIGAGGRYLILMSIDPRTGGPAGILAANAAYYDYCRKFRNTIFCDTARYWLDQTSATFDPIGASGGGVNAVTADGLHASAYGCYLKRQAVQKVIDTLYRPTRVFLGCAADVYNDPADLLGNVIGAQGRFTALGGTKGLTGGVETGTPPAGWTSTGNLGTGITVAWSTTTSSLMDAYTGIAGTPCVRATLTGTAINAGTLEIVSPGSGYTAGPGLPWREGVVFAFNNAVGMRITSLYSNAVPNSTYQIGGDRNGNNVSEAYNTLPTLNALMTLENYVVDTSSFTGMFLHVVFNWGAGAILSGSIDLISAFARRSKY